jgi:alpha-glucosidase (family GH31 glycosyl hydrolase)
MNYPAHRELFGIDDEFMLGDALLVKGVEAAGTARSSSLEST